MTALHITSKSEAGNVDENIPVKINGDNIEIGFNSKYLIDGLKVMKEDNIVISLNTNVRGASYVLREATALLI